MSTEKSIEQVLIEKAIRDPAFKAELKANPRAALAKELGADELPADFAVEVLEATENKFYIVLPSDTLLAENEELSDEQLEAIAGGVLAAGCVRTIVVAKSDICLFGTAVRSRP